MRAILSVALIALAAPLVAAPPCLAQSAAPTATAPVLTPAEMEQFLLRGEIVRTRRTRKGVTDAMQVTLTDGKLTHDAQIQDVDIALPIFQVDPKHTEVNFKDTYRYNIAGYRLALLLGLDNVPMSVERKVNGKPVAVTWWIDNVILEEGDRQKKDLDGPNPSRTAAYLHILRVFDELIQNRDRNAGNLMWTSDWKMWMIDHTRAFRLGKNLLRPEQLQRCERTLFQKMRELTSSALAEVMGRILTRQEIAALLARRDLIVALFESKIAERGEAAVLYTLPE